MKVPVNSEVHPSACTSFGRTLYHSPSLQVALAALVLLVAAIVVHSFGGKMPPHVFNHIVSPMTAVIMTLSPIIISIALYTFFSGGPCGVASPSPQKPKEMIGRSAVVGSGPKAPDLPPGVIPSQGARRAACTPPHAHSSEPFQPFHGRAAVLGSAPPPSDDPKS